MARPGKAPTSAEELSPGVWLARGKHPHPVHPRSSVPAAHRVSVASPRTDLASGKLPTRLLSLPCAPTGSYFLYPSRAGIPSTTGGFASTFRTLPNILCGLLKQAPQSTKTLINSFTLFRIFESLSPLL